MDHRPGQERPRDPADQGVAAFSSANTNTHRTIASDRGLLRPDVSAGSGGRGKNLPRVLLFGAVLVSPRERRFAVPRTRQVSGVRVCLACRVTMARRSSWRVRQRRRLSTSFCAKLKEDSIAA